MSRIVREQGVTVVELGPRYDSLDDECLAQFTEVLLAEATGDEPPRLVLDLSDTTFIGSHFIGVLVRAWKRVRDRDGTMALCSVQPFCQEALENTRLLNTLWATYSTREEAISALENE